ncbi:hypothetical protein FOCC_FOCC008740 [Frankliniella occidentalis]|nr:hypothetical protein FOCC_FOCC008740 [Frankliniella occidentalis]
MNPSPSSDRNNSSRHDPSRRLTWTKGQKLRDGTRTAHSQSCKKTTMNSQGIQVESLGGGQIVHDPRARTITIGGMSHGLGKADHNLSAALLSRYYPGYKITVET